MELLKLKGIRPFLCTLHFVVENTEDWRRPVVNPEPECRSITPSPMYFLLQQADLHLDSSPSPQRNIALDFKKPIFLSFLLNDLFYRHIYFSVLIPALHPSLLPQLHQNTSRHLKFFLKTNVWVSGEICQAKNPIPLKTFFPVSFQPHIQILRHRHIHQPPHLLCW